MCDVSPVIVAAIVIDVVRVKRGAALVAGGATPLQRRCYEGLMGSFGSTKALPDISAGLFSCSSVAGAYRCTSCGAAEGVLDGVGEGALGRGVVPHLPIWERT